MGRINQRGLELSFKPYGLNKVGGRWCKKVGGKRYYFGSGKSVSDRRSYSAALKKYRAWAEQQATLSHVKRLREQLLEHTLANIGIGITNPDEFNEYITTGKSTVTDKRIRNHPIINAAIDNVLLRHAGQDETDIDTMKEGYLASEQLRRDRTAKDPDSIRRKDRLSAKSFRAIEYCITAFCNYARKSGRLVNFTDAAAVEKVLRDYRAHIESEMAKGKITGSTVNARTAYLRKFFDYLWRGHHIDEMPRCITEVTRKYTGTPAPKPLDHKVVRKLWKAATGRERAMLALGLNCAAYAAEIADMQVNHLVKKGRATYLAKRRGKTGVPYKIKLWSITHRLVKRHADGRKEHDLLFVTDTGLPLVHQTGKSESDAIARSLKDLAERAQVSVTWSQLRDTAAVAIKNIGVKIGVQGLEDQLLAHATHKVSRFYAEQEPIELETSRLDEALDEFRKQLKLTTK